MLLGGKRWLGQVTTIRQRFSQCHPEMTTFGKKCFGPVAAITIAKDAEHALELANG
ncbi:hypothetical protein ACNKHW_09710 [Shigella flexneri]